MTKSCSGNHTRQTKPKKRGDNNQTPATSFSDGDTGQPAEKEPDEAQSLSGSDFDLSEKIKESIDYGMQLYYEGKNNNCSEGDGCPICNSCQSQIKQKIKRQVVKDIKTFIKKLKPLVNKYVKYTVDKMAMWDEIYKLAGNDLK